MIIYAVHYSNYEPPEINSLWVHKEHADIHCAYLNDKARREGMNSYYWQVDPFTVNEVSMIYDEGESNG